MGQTVIYTAIFGNREPLREPKFRPPGCDFVCFTDQPFSSVTWLVRRMKAPHIDPLRASRKIKILAHRYVPEYEQSVWIDGNLIVRGDVNELLQKYLSEAPLAVFRHAHGTMDPHNSLKEEVAFLIHRAAQGKSKDDPAVIQAQLSEYERRGFPDTNGLSINMVILRKHNNPNVVAAMNLWWDEYDAWSKRDQMSFNYVMWKTGLPFTYMDGDSRNNPYFQWVPHEHVPYLTRKWHKLLKYVRY